MYAFRTQGTVTLRNDLYIDYFFLATHYDIKDESRINKKK